ncbi:MAG TPA: hypothetical protein VGQ57_10450 [Polyangiaceae bacterium]|nr:hypothetical protein [Polyangiaceae bacterium]
MKRARCYGGYSSALLALATACGGEPVTQEFQEPIRAQGADFVEGELPGSRPLTGEEQGAMVPPQPPYVIDVNIANSSIVVGSAALQIPGSVTTDASAVGFRFADLGSGYWVRPVTTQNQNGGFTFGIDATISSEAPVGKHTLLFAAIAPDGRSGTQKDVVLCVEPRIPDKHSDVDPTIPGNACDPKREPPALVVSLGWDTAVDLDLKIVTPSGKLVDPKHPNTADPVDGKVDLDAPGVGVLDRDSNGDCRLDDLNRENLVFETQPEPGRYAIYADLYEACGKSSVRFETELVARVAGAAPDSFEQVTTFRQGGVLTAAQADGGSKLGLFVSEFVVQ